MKTKQFGIIIVTILVLIGVFGSNALATINDSHTNEMDILDIVSEKEVISFGMDENETKICTAGPITLGLEIADITFIDGPWLKLQIISWLLYGRNHIFMLLPKVEINVTDLSFSIRYTKNIPDMELFQRFSYCTSIIDNGENESYSNEKHMVIVADFEGTFSITRMKPLKLLPAYFRFSGYCEDAIIVT